MTSLASLAASTVLAGSAAASATQLVMLGLVVLGIAGAVWWFFIRKKKGAD